jgi:hypothetical protein
MSKNARFRGSHRRAKLKGRQTVAGLESQYERVKAELLKLGPVVQGSILARMVEREDPRRPGQMRQLGPYYQWTRKLGGRTVNVNLTATQARAWRHAIAQHRRLESLLDRMRELSLKILQTTTEGVKKRKSRKIRD